MRLQLAKLQESDDKAQKIRVKRLKNGYKKVDRVLHYYRLPFIPEINQTKLISWHHNNSWVGYFGVNKTKDLVGRKYYWVSLWIDIEFYVKGFNVCLASKAVKHKLYSNLQFLPVPNHQ